MALNCNIFFVRVSYRDGGIGVVSQQLYSVLTRLQMGLIEDKMDWTVELR
jgi:branched-chain amino acid aminotransferase